MDSGIINDANAWFVQQAEQRRHVAALDGILCEVHERAVGRDNCVRFNGLALQGIRVYMARHVLYVARYAPSRQIEWEDAQAGFRSGV